MRKITFTKPLKYTVTPGQTRTIKTPALARTRPALDFAQARWLIDPNAQTVKALMKGDPEMIIMGAGAVTAFPASFTEASLEAAYIAQLDALNGGAISAAIAAQQSSAPAAPVPSSTSIKPSSVPSSH